MSGDHAELFGADDEDTIKETLRNTEVDGRAALTVGQNHDVVVEVVDRDPPWNEGKIEDGPAWTTEQQATAHPGDLIGFFPENEEFSAETPAEFFDSIENIQYVSQACTPKNAGVYASEDNKAVLLKTSERRGDEGDQA